MKIDDRKSTEIVSNDVKDSRMGKKKTTENNFAHGEKEKKDRKRKEM